jgi:hypothetical protein
MNRQVKDIFAKAQTLSAEEREQLAELLLARVDADFDFDQVWAEEAGRRWQHHKDSGEPAIDALAAVEDVRSTLKRQR